jgi:putative integral membrane protein (TIGR02587 family)
MARSRKGSSAGSGSDRGARTDRGAGDGRAVQDGGAAGNADSTHRNGDGGDRRSIDDTARDHLRAVAGGLFVGLPLLWTMEMWEQGASLPPLKLLLLFGLAFGIVVGFNAVSGFRRERTWVELLIDAVQGMGLAIVVAAAMLFALGRLEPELGLPTWVGRVGLLSIPVAFGTALAATVLSEPEEGGGREPVGPIGRLFVAAGGALYFALNVAPTDEVRVLGSEADVPLLLLVMIGSLVISLLIVFVVELPGGRRASTPGSRGGGPIDEPAGETIAAYVIALFVSVVLIFSFGLSDGLGLRALVGYVVLLGTLAAFGSAAGRLLVGGESGDGERPPA